MRVVEEGSISGGYRIGFKFLWVTKWVIARSREDCVVINNDSIKRGNWCAYWGYYHFKSEKLNKLFSLLVKYYFRVTEEKPQKIVYPKSVTRESGRVFLVGRQELKDEYDNNKWLLPISPNYKYDPELP